MDVIREAFDKLEEEIKIRDNEIIWLRQEGKSLRCHTRTLYASANVKRLCPKCQKYMLLEGYVCFGCGYDEDIESSE